MSDNTAKRQEEHRYFDKVRQAWLPKHFTCDLGELTDKEVQEEKIAMLQHIDASLRAMLKQGIQTSAYDYDSHFYLIADKVDDVSRELRNANHELGQLVRPMLRIAGALERIAPESQGRVIEDMSDEEIRAYLEFRQAVERDD